MDGNNFSCVGKKRTNVIINFVLSLICFVCCIFALDKYGKGDDNGFMVFIILDMVLIGSAFVTTSLPGKAAMWCYIGGSLCSLTAFIIMSKYSLGTCVIFLTISQCVCAISSALMQVTISFVNEFLSAIGSSQVLIPLESIDYIKKGIFSMVDFRSSAGRISCIFVQDANTLYRSVFENRKNRLASHTTGSVNYTQSSLIDELPEL